MKLLDLIFISENDMMLALLAVALLITALTNLTDYDSIIIKIFRRLKSIFK